MRQKTLEDKQLEMAQIVKALNTEIEKLEGLFSKKEITKDNLNSIYESENELDILFITNYKDFLGKIALDIAKQEQVIKNVRIILRSKQQEVAEAYKEVKIMEKLKEKQEKDFYQNYQHLEAKELDDIASTRYHRMSA